MHNALNSTCRAILLASSSVLLIAGSQAKADTKCTPRWPDYTSKNSFYHEIGGDSTTLIVCSNVDGLLVGDISSLRKELSCGKSAPVIDGANMSAPTTGPHAYIFISTNKISENLKLCIRKSQEFSKIDTKIVHQQIIDPRKNLPIIDHASIPGVDRYEKATSANYNYSGDVPFAVISIFDLKSISRLAKEDIFSVNEE